MDPQLPTKQDEVLFCPLTPEQIRIYKLFLDEFGKDTEGRGRVLKFISIFIKVIANFPLCALLISEIRSLITSP
jgi:SNF2 family DNA or RNA helicase